MFLLLQVVLGKNVGSKHIAMTLLVIVFVLVHGQLAFGGEVADKYAREHAEATAQQLATSEKSRSSEQVESTTHGITEIGIERGACFGTCPMYTFIIKSNGTCRYKGEKYVERIGEFACSLPMWDFHELAQFLRDADYMGLESNYSRLITDHPTIYTTVVMYGKRKVIRNYANAGPTTLWAIEQLIDRLLTKVTWNGTQNSEEKKK